MSEGRASKVVIVDYGVGNLYSVKNACRQVGLPVDISGAPAVVASADAAVLPGIGAFGDAMATLRRLDLVGPLRDLVAAGRPVFGVCLGLQLLMSESYEFGLHRGLGLIEGTVTHLGRPRAGGDVLKVPHVGWTRIDAADRAWTGTMLDGVVDGSYMYFVHSYRVEPADPSLVLSYSTYGDVRFCSSIQSGNLFACQFHPERSTHLGLRLYANFKHAIERSRGDAPLGSHNTRED